MVNECYTMEDSSIFKRKERKGAQRFRKGIPSHLCEPLRAWRLCMNELLTISFTRRRKDAKLRKEKTRARLNRKN